MATNPVFPLLDARGFLEIDFHERRAELDNGVIRMMAGGTARHSDVQTNILAALRIRLRGTGCRPHASDMAIRTHDLSVRYPDVSVRCGPIADAATSCSDPVVVVEILSAGTARTDLGVKLCEYRALPSVDTVVFVDIASERVRIVQREGPGRWSETEHADPAPVPLPALDVVLPHEEVFARD